MSNYSNLPPGVSVNDIPGNRPGDEEKELLLSLTLNDLEEIEYFVQTKGKNNLAIMIDIMKDILEQIHEEECDAEIIMNELVREREDLRHRINGLFKNCRIEYEKPLSQGNYVIKHDPYNKIFNRYKIENEVDNATR